MSSSLKQQVVESCLSAEVSGSQLKAEFLFPEDLPVLAGHFPGRPLIPGVFLVESLRAACERAWDKRLSIRTLREAKFTAEVLPGAPLSLEATCVKGEEGWSCEGRLRTMGKAAATLRLQLVERSEG